MSTSAERLLKIFNKQKKEAGDEEEEEGKEAEGEKKKGNKRELPTGPTSLEALEALKKGFSSSSSFLSLFLTYVSKFPLFFFRLGKCRRKSHRRTNDDH